MRLGVHVPLDGPDVPAVQDHRRVQQRDAEGVHRREGEGTELDEPNDRHRRHGHV